MFTLTWEEVLASDWSVAIIAAKYFIRTKLDLSIYEYLKRSHEQIHYPSSDESTEHTAARMIIPGTRWAVKTVSFSKACVLHQRVTALLPPSLPLSNEPWLAVWRGTSSIHYTSSPIFGRCRAAQHLSRLAEPCLPASAPPSHLHLIHTCSS